MSKYVPLPRKWPRVPFLGPVLTDCNSCGAPAEVVPWPRQSSLRFRRGPQRSLCVQGHWNLRHAAKAA